MPHPLRETLITAARLLEASGADSPRLSAELLLAKALETDRAGLLKTLVLDPGTAVPDDAVRRFQADVARRADGEPAAYITGLKEFYGRDFMVNPAVLIPRPETELLVDLALAFARGEQTSYGVFADFGTGSGCIAVSLALELPGWRGLALDKSAPALKTAAHNAQQLGAAGLALAEADFTAPPLKPGCLDMLVSNPPYVSEAEYNGLGREVKAFEPRSALVPAAGADASGLEDALVIIELAATLLRPGGLLLMEMGCGQGPALFAALRTPDWTAQEVRQDLARLDRVLLARRSYGGSS